MKYYLTVDGAVIVTRYHRHYVSTGYQEGHYIDLPAPNIHPSNAYVPEVIDRGATARYDRLSTVTAWDTEVGPAFVGGDEIRGTRGLKEGMLPAVASDWLARHANEQKFAWSPPAEWRDIRHGA